MPLTLTGTLREIGYLEGLREFADPDAPGADSVERSGIRVRLDSGEVVAVLLSEADTRALGELFSERVRITIERA